MEGKKKFPFLIALFLAAVFSSAAQTQVREEFRNPPKLYRPMVRWFWPGGDVVAEELKREVGLMDEANFGGGEIQPCGFSLNPRAPAEVEKRVNDYLTPSFYSRVRAALEEARRRGLWLDYTFGSGWPFGGAHIPPELASMELRVEHKAVRGPLKFKEKILLPERPPAPKFPVLEEFLFGIPRPLPEGWEERLRQREKLVAVVAVRGEEALIDPAGLRGFFGQTSPLLKKTGRLDAGSTVVLTDRVSADGTLAWDMPEGDWQLFTFAQSATDQRLLGGVGEGPRLVLDHMNLAALEAHLKAVGDSAKEHVGAFFGGALRAVFCDSLEVGADIFWTDTFLADFRRLRGYDLTPFLPVVKEFGGYRGQPFYDFEGSGSRIRHDYWQTVSDVMIANFYQPFADWAGRHNLQTRVQAHGAPVDVLKAYGLSHIPETEDLYSGGRYDFLKYAASAAHVYGRKLASSETFVAMGNPYATTPEFIKRRADELLTAGINQIIYSGFPYEYMDRAEPGWYPFSAPLPYSTNLSPHNPFWEYLKPLNAYITRLQYLFQTGNNVAPAALFRGNLAYKSGSLLPSGLEINSGLMGAGYNFDHINTDALLKSRAERGRLISPGGASYGCLILPNEERVALELAEKLAGFARSGVPVLYIGSVPREEIGFRDYPQRTLRIQALLKDTPLKTTEEAIAGLKLRIPPNLRFTGPAPWAFFIQKKLGPLDVYFLRNGSADTQRVGVIFPAHSSPEIWDPWTGDISPALDFEAQADGVRMDFDLAPYGSRLIVFDPARKHAPQAPKPRPQGEPVNIGGKWLLEAAGQQLELPDLVDWSQHPQLRSFSGKAHYTIRFFLPKVSPMELDLGEVKDVAEIRLNGKSGPTLLLRPYRAEVTGLLQPGENVLEVTVANALTNRLLATGADLAGLFGFGKKLTPQPSGLMGPVRLLPR